MDACEKWMRTCRTYRHLKGTICTDSIYCKPMSSELERGKLSCHRGGNVSGKVVQQRFRIIFRLTRSRPEAFHTNSTQISCCTPNTLEQTLFYVPCHDCSKSPYIGHHGIVSQGGRLRSLIGHLGVLKASMRWRHAQNT